MSSARTGSYFLSGLIFGSVYYLINIHWVVTAVSVFGGSPFFVGALVTVLFALILGFFWGVFGFVYGKKPASPLLLAGAAVALEAVRSNIFSGFPMLNLAHTQYTFLPAIQIAEVTGEHGVSLAVAYFNTALACFFLGKNKKSLISAAVLVCAVFAYGFLVNGQDYAGKDIRLRIIQPSYSQADKWVPEKKYDIMALVNGMIRETDGSEFDMVILPETVYPALLDQSFAGYHVLQLFAESVPVIAGGLRTSGGEVKTYYNSVFYMHGEKEIVYDKLHLVPFGEYFPMKSLFKPIDYYFFQGAEDFSPGKDPILFVSEKYKAAPMICYESMYSSLVRDQAVLGADIFTVVTNDSWFGATAGPYQHLATDVLRAVEFRKPFARAAQSGISACISPSGEITGRLATGQKGFLDCTLRTHSGLTMFAYGGYGWLAVFLFTAWYFSRKKQS